ncbi:D-alanyl-D-alanine carboxypeptidase/D-alanyl-D-alanine endopeptidase [Actinoalloteichus hymeniacidonis]|uniref:D-alanyl-D-alanine carboxypeptidase, serine-type, PBP4 family n=1 Tax=Actinoalloteichus hymeniacidonis TaxID=340345 RepID=A0AAC9HRD7_9PSEU|nr:D-alanyl-D-alanine carboxypeptidase/D-alanyl-D-alanine-endopeptidase [Actinoalloteichus hymeniacidonis]AOS63561.1 D-alanyl-D-alanine carboxypeptidase, serine-type, PBP4 family [Actinoalloteichus hymeniacidonis]MBB5908393.1 D-alanyl-D-alanine carboxypeptidase/D-alanyl-D-alanine-endopeptidase (penicillin-binding protein 4) [Actinoalloteichus hymeniacidonis]
MTSRLHYVGAAVTAVSLIGLLALPGMAGSTEPIGDQALASDLDRILADSRLDGAGVGVVVRTVADGETLYQRGAEELLLPASNAKLLSSVAALEALGPDYRFRTEVSSPARRYGGVLNGDLYLRGTGDPTLLAEDYDALAADIADAGIDLVRGDLVADDTWFDDVRLGTGWAWDDEPYYYSAQISALTVAPDTDYDAGTVIVEVAPGAEEGAPPEVTVEPPTDHVTVDVRATTSAAGSTEAITVHRERGGNAIRVDGSIALDGAPTQDWSTVWEPTDYAADVFHRALADHDVRVLGDVVRGSTPEHAEVLAEHDSMPLDELMVPFMKLSNNGHAEVLVKAMGAEHGASGSWRAGGAVLTDTLADLGLPAADYRLVDGSGLSRMDMVTADQLTTLLVAAGDRPWFSDWYESLPIAGESDRLVGGTLRNRLAGTEAAGNVHAKTGSLTGVTGLSGYVTAASGEELVFSVVFNNYLGASPKDIEDLVALRLARYAGEQDRVIDVETLSTPEIRLPVDDPRTPVDESALECTWARAC